MGWQVAEPPRPPATVPRLPWRVADAWGLRLPVLVGLLQGGGFGVLVTFVPAYAQTAGLAFTPFFVAYTATLISTRVFGGGLVDRGDRRAILPPFLLLATAALLLLVPAVGMWQLVLSGLLFGLAHGVLYPVLSAIVLDQARPEHRGRAIGLFSLAFSVGANLTIMLYGMVADLWGYGWMFAVAAAALGAAAAYARWGERAAPKVGELEPAA